MDDKGNTEERAAEIELVRSNIRQHGHHIYVVAGKSPLPRFAYTIGLSPTLGYELVFAGGLTYMLDEVLLLINTIAGELRAKSTSTKHEFNVGELGNFSLRQADESWSRALLLGAQRFYGQPTPAVQIVPDAAHTTFDVPDMGRKLTNGDHAWKWISQPWTYPVSAAATATTNLDALRGGRITEAARWEEDQWELFAGPGPDVSQEDVRVVPLATLLAADATLGAVVSLAVGQAFWRDAEELTWHEWK